MEALLHFTLFMKLPNMPKINNSFVVLIPKRSQAHWSITSKFRPKSLCNVVYKIISKVVANRFKGVLSSIIEPFRSAFIKGRMISDNYRIAHEVIRSFKKKKRTTIRGFKLDVAKNDDRME